MAETPAEAAGRAALHAVRECVDAGQSFLLEAGAGAGKTFSLVETLRYLLERDKNILSRRNQRIACITYTNVAKEQIEKKVDRNPFVFCDTNHGFCWFLISGFQKQLRELVVQMDDWRERLEENGGIGNRAVSYLQGYRYVAADHVSLHHDDVLPLAIKLMELPKFRRLMVEQFPVILIDEYQDTDIHFMEAIKTHFLGQPHAPLFGFFGDHWQKIYGEDRCGRVTHPAIREIGKEANFRSVATIVEVLNRMRPALPQQPSDPASRGYARVFHTNSWTGGRQPAGRGGHWTGDLMPDVAHQTLERIKAQLEESGWDLSAEKTKILMLTHRVISTEQGYPSIPPIFRFNDDFLKKEHPYIAYLIDVLEPACTAYSAGKYGLMFEYLNAKFPLLRSHADKKAWSNAMDGVIALMNGDATVGAVIDKIRQTKRPRLPEKIENKERELAAFDKNSGEEFPRALDEIEKLRAVPYKEIKALRVYLEGHSPFETKHGVKGAQFENVLVVLGRGWNRYDFGAMLERENGTPPADENHERNRNLFYVACSRPQRRLALLFTQQLTPAAINTLNRWFGAEAVEAVSFQAA